MKESSQNEPAQTQATETEPSHYASIPPQRYEVTWLSGHVETVIAHQVSWPNNAVRLFTGSPAPSRVHFHAEVDGLWTLQLSALEDDLRTIRNVTAGESLLPGGGAL